VLAVLACAVVAVGLGAAPAAAHDEIVGTTPADGSTVETAPDEVVLTFAEPAAALGTQVVVTGPDAVTVSQGDVRLVGTTVVQPLVGTRPAGAYRVDWRVTSVDGHPVTGTFTFTAAGPLPAPIASTPPTSPTAAPAASPPAVATTRKSHHFARSTRVRS
jgi:methionine-rich copper-binding protein CopC